MPATLDNIADVKLYILCILNYVGYPLAYPDINDMVMFDGAVLPLDFFEAFDLLVEDGLIIKLENNKYKISEQGSFIAKTLKSDLAGYVHHRGLNAALRFVSFRKSNTKYDMEYTERPDGKYDAVFTFSREGEELMNLRLTLDTLYQAKKMKVSFYEDPEALYIRVIGILSGVTE